MAENNGLVKRTTHAQLEKPSSGSALSLSPRQKAIAALIQLTLKRRSLPLIESEAEMVIELRAWEPAIAHIPDAHLQRAYDRAAGVWDWLDLRRPFTADSVAFGYADLVAAEREEAEAERHRKAFENPGAIACEQCCDEGYASVFVWKFNRWYGTRRPCFCPAAPAAQRTEPLAATVWRRDRLGRYARHEDIATYGPPDRTFEALTPAPQGEEESAEAAASA